MKSFECIKINNKGQKATFYSKISNKKVQEKIYFILHFKFLYFLIWIIFVRRRIDNVSNDEREPLQGFIELVDQNVQNMENIPRDCFSINGLPGACSGYFLSGAADYV